jgi:hypothetical protein
MSALSSCNSCGFQNLFESKFCPECGTSLVEEVQNVTLQKEASPLKSYLLNPKNRLMIYLVSGGALLTIVLFITIGSFGTSIGGVSSNASASDYVTGYNRNMMRLNGLDVIDSDGNEITLGQFAEDYLYFLESRLGYDVSASDVAIGLAPGGSLDSALHQFFSDENAIAVVGAEMQNVAG